MKTNQVMMGSGPQTPLLNQGASPPRPSDLHGEGTEPWRTWYMYYDHVTCMWSYMVHIWSYMDHIWPYMGHIWSCSRVPLSLPVLHKPSANTIWLFTPVRLWSWTPAGVFLRMSLSFWLSPASALQFKLFFRFVVRSIQKPYPLCKTWRLSGTVYFRPFSCTFSWLSGVQTFKSYIDT